MSRSPRRSPRPAILAASAAFAVALGLGGCGGAPCPSLAADLCEGGDADYCKAVDAWLQTRLVDPQTKQPLGAAERDQMCTAIHKNVEMFYGYQFKSKQKILGEPDFILASQKKAREEARAYEAAMKEIKKDDEEQGGGGANMSD